MQTPGSRYAASWLMNHRKLYFVHSDSIYASPFTRTSVTSTLELGIFAGSVFDTSAPVVVSRFGMYFSNNSRTTPALFLGYLFCVL